MRAGNLDRVIDLQRRNTGLDLYGTPMETWTTFANVRAQLLQNASDYREGARGTATHTVITFRTRWLDLVTLEDRVMYQGQHFDIRDLKEIGRRIALDITCERVGS